MASWSYECSFESAEGFSTGALSGQGGWGAPIANDFSVVNTQAAQGTQSLYTGQMAGVDRGGNYKTITACDTDGSIAYISFRADNVTSVDNFGMHFLEGSTFVFTYYMGAPGANDISLREESGGTFRVVETSAAADTWYRMGVEMDFTGNRVRGNVNNGTMSSYITCAAFGQIDKLRTIGGNGDGASKAGWLDWISASYTAGSGPTNLKSLDTNVAANIKSYNTNALANIKSIDTNA